VTGEKVQLATSAAAKAKDEAEKSSPPEAQEAKTVLQKEETMNEPKSGVKALQSSDKGREEAVETSARVQAPAGMLAGAGNVDKIRDILFGNQMREYEKRFTRLEERMHKEIGNLKEDLKKHFDTLESYVKKEMELLSDRQKSEKSDRSTAIQELAKELKDTASVTEKKISNVEDQLNKRSRELHDQILEQSKSLSAEIRERHEAISAALERETQELYNDKVDRSSLSELFMEMAMRLSNESSLNLVKSGLLDE